MEVSPQNNTVAAVAATPKRGKPPRRRPKAVLRTELYTDLVTSRGLGKVGHQAAAFEVHRGTLHKITTGRVEPSLSTALDMAATLGVPVEALFARGGRSPKAA